MAREGSERGRSILFGFLLLLPGRRHGRLTARRAFLLHHLLYNFFFGCFRRGSFAWGRLGHRFALGRFDSDISERDRSDGWHGYRGLVDGESGRTSRQGWRGGGGVGVGRGDSGRAQLAGDDLVRERGGVLELAVGGGERVGGGGRTQLQLAGRLATFRGYTTNIIPPLFSGSVTRDVSMAVTLESKLG